MKITGVQRCHVVGMIFQNPKAEEHYSYLLKSVELPKKVVLEENLDMISKKMLRGDHAIDLVRKTLGYLDDAPVYAERIFRKASLIILITIIQQLNMIQTKWSF